MRTRLAVLGIAAAGDGAADPLFLRCRPSGGRYFYLLIRLCRMARSKINHRSLCRAIGRALIVWGPVFWETRHLFLDI